ncbi:MAG TPA: M23 family metallopeptidase [Thermoanaerobacterales bacterium]|nr:M23 family metallopeptidase [Thermoanaerobacterales bacterium]
MNNMRLLSKVKAAIKPYKRLPGFLYKKSFHIVASLCLITIIATIAWSLRNPIIREPDNYIVENEEDVLGQTNIVDEKEESKDIEEEQEIAIIEHSIPIVENVRPIVDKQSNEKETKPDLSVMMPPVVGKTIVDFAVDELIYSRTLEQWQTHPGIDIVADEGTPVKAVLSGTIVDTLYDAKLGNLVVIDHGDGIISRYGNLKSFSSVEKGQVIKKSEVIGAVGKSSLFESEDPPHLHFELKIDNKPVDPKRYLPKIE